MWLFWQVWVTLCDYLGDCDFLSNWRILHRKIDECPKKRTKNCLKTFNSVLLYTIFQKKNKKWVLSYSMLIKLIFSLFFPKFFPYPISHIFIRKNWIWNWSLIGVEYVSRQLNSFYVEKNYFFLLHSRIMKRKVLIR